MIRGVAEKWRDRLNSRRDKIDATLPSYDRFYLDGIQTRQRHVTASRDTTT